MLFKFFPFPSFEEAQGMRLKINRQFGENEIRIQSIILFWFLSKRQNMKIIISVSPNYPKEIMPWVQCWSGIDFGGFVEI